MDNNAVTVTMGALGSQGLLELESGKRQREEIRAQHERDIIFEGFPKIPRFREMIVTEKIDGTNAAVVVCEYDFGTHVDGVPEGTNLVLGRSDHTDDGLPDKEFLVYAQSRKRLIEPNDADAGKKGVDNYGFAQWVKDNSLVLCGLLGPGRHYGEWWGKGIQRGYDADQKYFSLFNTKRWDWLNYQHARYEWMKRLAELHKSAENASFPAVRCVPTLYNGDFSTEVVKGIVVTLGLQGSQASPGFMEPEGVVVYQPNCNRLSKMTRNGDGGKFSQ